VAVTRLDRFLAGLIRRWRYPTTGNHLSPRHNELVYRALWGDLSDYNAERSRGVEHKPNYVALMRRKQEFFDETNAASYREAGFMPLHNAGGTVIGWSGEGLSPRMLHWDEARLRELYPDWAHVAFDYVYDSRDDTVAYVTRRELLTAGL
jgi:hypothetical protein